MQNDWVFECENYHSVLQRMLKEEGVARGYRSQLARAGGFQPAYLNHILTGHAHLTPDQSLGLCDFWTFDELQSDYFMTLVHLARAATQRLSENLRKRLERIKAEHRNTRKSRLSHKTYDPERAIEYYLDWEVAAIHTCLMVPRLNTVSKISQRLRIEENRVRKALAVLQDLGFAEGDHNHWKATSIFLHAADESKFAKLHHTNWRSRALEYIQSQGVRSGSFHFTAIQSLSASDLVKARELLGSTVKTLRSVIAPSPEETVACISVDCFEI